VEKVKGYSPELNFNERKEILEAIRYVDDVVPSPWLIDDSFLDKHKMDFLVHGHDNSNPVSKDRLIILNRTDGISSTMLRMRVVEAVKQINLSKNYE
jgi:glycerol-3-phosphate cytidylyltransferase-like family protein